MHKQKLTAIVVALAMFPLHVVAAAGSLHADDTVAGVPTTISLQSMPQGTYDIVVHENGGNAADDIVVPVAVSAAGSADAMLRTSETEKAGMYVVTLEQNGTALSATARFTVEPGPIDTAQSDVMALSPTVIVGGDTITVIARATDGFGNPLAGRPLTLLASRPTDTVTPDMDETDENGEQSFRVSTEEAGTVYLRAMDLITGQMFAQGTSINATIGGIGNAPRTTSPSYAGQVTSGGKTFYYAAQATSPIISGFTITGPKRVKADNPIPRLTVAAKDDAGKPAIGYEGTIICSSTDPAADLPDSYTFLGSERGRHNFDVNFILSTSGAQDIKCEDSENSDIFGTITIDVQGGGGGDTSTAGIILSEPKPDQWINSLEINVTGEGPELVNIIIDAGGQSVEPVVVGSDEQGHFSTRDPEYDPEDPESVDNSTPLILRPGQTDYTIFVDREGGGARKTVTVHFDDAAPEIGTVTFAPEEPREGENVLAVVETDENATVTMRFTKQSPPIDDILLTEESGTPGTYQAMFKAPATGKYQIDVMVTDLANNETVRRVVLNVGTEGLGIVKNLTAVAVPTGGKANLKWDPVENATGYEIYVATEKLSDDSYDWEDPLKTNKEGKSVPANEAEVAGIPAGGTRYFAVIAVQEIPRSKKLESPEMSNVVKVTMPGMILEATTQDSSVALKWSGLPKDLQVDSYLLTYGPAPDDMREFRSIAGKAQSQQVRDLINGVTYYFELTPITVAGVKIDELAATDDGMPNGSGFHAAPADPIPYNVATQAPPTPVHAGAPLEDTGLPSYAWLALIAAGIAGTLYWHRRRSIQRTMLLLEQMAKQYGN